MADFNENELRLAAHSPNFLKQRKIAYVDNPFDEQASQSMAQKCNIKYINFPRNQNSLNAKISGHNGAEKKLKKEGEEDVWKLGTLVNGEENDFASTEQDWSCLFSPVQVIFMLNIFSTKRYTRW